MPVNFMQLGASVLNTTQKSIASSPVEFYSVDGALLTDSVVYDAEGNIVGSPLMAVVSTLAEEMATMVFDGQTDNRRVDFIVNTTDLPFLPKDGYFIRYATTQAEWEAETTIKYNCFQRDGQPHAGKYSDQFNQRFRIHTRREGD
jgi:hypothetical protein